MNGKSTFEIEQLRESQAVELRYDERKEWTREGDRTRGQSASVVIDGTRIRITAKRMLVREKRIEYDQFWVAPR